MSSGDLLEASGVGEELAVDDVGEVAFEGADRFAAGAALGAAAGQIGAGPRVDPGLSEGDQVDCAVEPTVAAAAEAVADALT
jgi:hypothetical protein